MFTRVRDLLTNMINMYFNIYLTHCYNFTLFAAGQVQITNAFDSSTIEINPTGFDVQDYLQLYVNYTYEVVLFRVSILT